MPSFPSKRILSVIVLAVVVLAFIAYALFSNDAPESIPEAPVAEQSQAVRKDVVGMSVEGRAIESFSYGTGADNLLFVGGIHGGYEWNSVLLAYQFMDYLEANPTIVPANLTVTIIPSANPDGVYAVTGVEGRFVAADASKDATVAASGRFNANGVDLNRNFDCKWKPESTWRQQTVSAGTSAFSEPEAQAIRGAVSKYEPEAVVFWHSQANAVYASECEAGVLPSTLTVMNAYAKAAGYPAVASFDAYPVSGDAEGWLASIGIPAITVELSTHEAIEWEKNLAGAKALFMLYAQ